ncbi:hypothetical protein ACPCHQ_21785 [Ralstonia thomasii]|uniref:hypothetical protein n=1 Tax=Ralstonia thomasii TaxID=3058596 RepID=UPI003C2D6C8F
MTYRTHSTRELSLVTLDAKQSARTGGNWYMVLEDGCRAAAMLATRSELMSWLEQNNLALTLPLPEHGRQSAQLLADKTPSVALALIAKLLVDAHQVQKLAPNADTAARIAEAERLLLATA